MLELNNKFNKLMFLFHLAIIYIIDTGKEGDTTSIATTSGAIEVIETPDVVKGKFLEVAKEELIKVSDQFGQGVWFNKSHVSNIIAEDTVTGRKARIVFSNGDFFDIEEEAQQVVNQISPSLLILAKEAEIKTKPPQKDPAAKASTKETQQHKIA